MTGWVRIMTVALAILLTLCIVAAGAWYFLIRSVEQPQYSLLRSDGPIEIRSYPDLVVAESRTGGDRDDGVRQGFRALAGYIFARDRPGEKISMTAPVIQEQAGDDGWAVRFVMPSQYALQSLPAPGSNAVSLDGWQPGQVAAIRFRGRWNDALFAEKEAALRDWLDKNDLRPTGPPVLAYYDDPFTPGFLRRNEVWLRLAPGSGQ